MWTQTVHAVDGRFHPSSYGWIRYTARILYGRLTYIFRPNGTVSGPVQLRPYSRHVRLRCAALLTDRPWNFIPRMRRIDRRFSLNRLGVLADDSQDWISDLLIAEGVGSLDLSLAGLGFLNSLNRNQLDNLGLVQKSCKATNEHLWPWERKFHDSWLVRNAI